MKIVPLLCLLVCLAPVAHAQDPNPPPAVNPGAFPSGPGENLAASDSFMNLLYVTGGVPHQMLDLYVPKDGSNFSLIIYVHGGGWENGAKGNPPDLPYLKQGYAVASINYRLSSEAVFPAQIEDCKAAVRYLRAHAAQYHLNAGRFAAWGKSAGGHLVALLGTTGTVKKFDVGDNLDVSSNVQAVIDEFGPTDFLQMDPHKLPGGMTHDRPDSPESKLIGGKIGDHSDLVAAANPITYLTKDAPPFFIAHGDADSTVPHYESELLNQALQAAGVPVTFYTVPGGHHGFKDPTVDGMIGEFLAKYLPAH